MRPPPTQHHRSLAREGIRHTVYAVSLFSITYAAAMRPRWILLWAVVGMLLLGSVIAVPSTSDAEFTASISLSPPSGPAGTTVTAEGYGFDPFAKVELHWDGPTGTVLADSSANPNGGVSLTFKVPASTAGKKAVVVCQTLAPCNAPKNNQHKGAGAYFTVTVKAPPQTTTSTSTSSTTSTTVPPSSSTSVVASQPETVGYALVKPGPDSQLGDGTWGKSYVPTFGEPVIPDVGVVPRCAPTAGSTIVDFDDVAPDTDVRETYASQGVHLAGSDLSAPSDVPLIVENALDQGTISEPNALRSPSFRSAPYLSLTFDRPQRVIGIHVGVLEARSGVVTLWAETDRGRIRDSLSLSDIGPTSVSNCLLIVVPPDVPNGVTHAWIQLPFEGTSRYDRLFFSENDDYEAPPVLTGSVTINAPYRERIDVANPVSLAGFARLEVPPAARAGRRFEHVYVTYVNRAGTAVRHADATVEPNRFSGSEGDISWHLDNLELPTGPIRISVVAVGPGIVARTVGEYEGYTDQQDFEQSAEFYDVVPIGMEVTQGISSGFAPGVPGGGQAADNVDVAGRHTVVRAFARLEQVVPGTPRRNQLPVRAWLLGYSGSRLLRGSPLTPENNAIPLRIGSAGDDITLLRTTAGGGWNFHLPESWTREGDIRLMLWVNPPGLGHVDEASGTNPALNLMTLSGQRFEAVDPRPMIMYLADLYWRENGEVRHAAPTLRELSTALARWELMFPVPNGGLSIAGGVTKRWALRACNEGESVRRDICSDGAVEGVPLWDNQEIWDEQPDFLARGRAVFVPLIFSPRSPIGCSGRAGIGAPPMFHGGACGGTLAQEAAHSLGLIHVSNAHGEEAGGGSFERYSGDHGEMESSALGWNIDTDQPILPTEGGTHRHDFMSYGGGNVFVSLDTWNRAATALRSANSTSNTDGPDIRGGAAREPSNVSTLIMTLTVRKDGVDLSPVSRTDTPIGPAAPIEKPAITVRVTGTGGTNTARLLTGPITHDLTVWDPEFTLSADDPGGPLRIEVIEASSGKVLQTFENVEAIAASTPSDDELVQPASFPILRTIGGDGITAPNRLVRFDADAVGGLEGLAITWLLDGEPIAGSEDRQTIHVGGDVGTHRITLKLSDGTNTGTIEQNFVIDNDEDRDGLGDTFEKKYRLDAADAADGTADIDGDLLSNGEEQRWLTDPRSIDTDGDNYRDDVELAGGSDPNDAASLPVALHGKLGKPVPTINNMKPKSDGFPVGALIAVVAGAIAIVVFSGVGVSAIRRRRR